MVDLLGFKVMLGNRVLNLLDGDNVIADNPRLPSSLPRSREPLLLPLEVYLRKSLSNSSSSKEGNAERVADAEALGVVGVDLEDDPEELVEGVRRWRKELRPLSQ